ncbi:hypothetical protein Ndes2437B_g07708 [Nannochloris sp. 'desiccata']
MLDSNTPNPLKMRLTLVILAMLALATLATQANAERALKDYDYCESWDYDWDINYRWVGGTSAGTKSAKNAAACGNICLNTDDCYTFTFYKRKCYMYEEDSDDLDSRYAKGYVAGYAYCDDKKKK